MESPRPRRERPLVEQHDEWMAHLGGQVVSRRTIVRGAVGAAAGSLLLGAGAWSDQAVAAVVASTGTGAGGFLVNGAPLVVGGRPEPGDVGRRPAVQPEQVQRGAAALGQGLARVRPGPLLRAHRRGGDSRAA